MSKTAKWTFESISKDIIQRRFYPIYLFMGDESYFIDKLTDLLTKTVLTEEEKDFNLHTFYGTDSDVNEIISVSRRFPMMAEHQLVIVKEAQRLDNIELLDVYAKKVMPSTVLVINHKYGNIDRRKSIVKNIDKSGVVFESKKLYENQIPAFITSWFKEKGIGIDAKSSQMLTDYVGNDISKLIPQLQKLEISLNKDTQHITSDLIENNIGISKDFNNFELQKAIVQKDVITANRIINYFAMNPKDNPMIVTIIVLFNFFSNLLECYWLPIKDEQSIMNTLNLRSSYFAREYTIGLKNYSARKVMDIISYLRKYDARCKGIDNISASQGELLKELIYKILH